MHKVLSVGPATTAISRQLRSAGHSVAMLELCERRTNTAMDLYEAFAGLPPEVVLIDLSSALDALPIRHLREICREIWGERAPLPTCLAMIAQRHLALPDLPAIVDDVILPPYDVNEALARISHMLFRLRQVRWTNKLSWAGVSLDLDRGIARDAKCRILPLTPKEFGLLAFLCSHRGKFFDRENLLNLVWGVQFQGSERTVDIHIRRLRAKLPADAAEFLETRRGLGYGLRDPH